MRGKEEELRARVRDLEDRLSEREAQVRKLEKIRRKLIER